MTTLAERFEAVDGESYEYEHVINKRSSYRDVHVFLLLTEIFPNISNLDSLVAAINYEELSFNIPRELLETLTDSQILELSRCGVFYDSEFGALNMYTAV